MDKAGTWIRVVEPGGGSGAEVVMGGASMDNGIKTDGKGGLLCSVCDATAAALINGMCGNCYSNNNCPKCHRGKLSNTGTPNWQNRWTCSNCKKHMSR